jgi:hypothetical protein
MFHDIHHPSFPLVKPVRTFLPVCITFVLAAVVAPESHGQITPRSRSVRQSEQVARANWQPTRSQSSSRSAPSPQNSLRAASLSAENGQAESARSADVRTVQAVAESIPVPTPDQAISIIQNQPSASAPQRVFRSGEVIQEGEDIMDGQVIINGRVIRDGDVIMESDLHMGSEVSLAPVYGDSGVTAGCDCGDTLCVGCDSSEACDSCGESCCGELCGKEAWRPCITLCLPQDGWATFEAIAWAQDGMYLPPLVTTSVNPNVTRNQAGVLTDPTTRVLLGDENFLSDGTDGGRFRVGVWLDRCHTWGLGGELFNLSSQSDSFTATSSGSPVLARPFFNTQTGVEDSELIAFPNVIAGTVNATVTSKFQGGGFHVHRLRRTEEGCKKWLFCGCPEHFCSRTEALFGYRYLQLEDGVFIGESLLSNDVNNPGAFEIADRFDTKNQFNGIDLGIKSRHTRGYWTFDGLVRLAIGNTRQTVKINGQSTINDPSSVPAVQAFPAGFLALRSNIGEYRQNQFAVVPEFGLTCGYQLTDHIRLTVGYTGIYWSNVVRPGQHMSRDINPNLLPPVANPTTGTNRPGFAFDTTDYWAQGINLGGEYRW